MRAYLLERNIIKEEEIRIEDIKTFESFKLINAMLEFDAPEIDIAILLCNTETFPIVTLCLPGRPPRLQSFILN